MNNRDNAEHCVFCGKTIPEGNQVCIICGRGKPKKQTNYDRIRNMSIEEMADVLSIHEDCEKYCAYTKDGKCNKFQYDGKGDCKDGVKLWLESEVED